MKPVHVVVDASVAKAASNRQRVASASPKDPPDALRGVQCALALHEIQRNKNIHIPFDTTLEREWLAHPNPTATSVLAALRSARRVENLPATWDGHAALLEQARTRLEASAAKAVEDDAHLVGLAVRTGHRVLSCDDKQKAHLSRLSRHHHVLQRIQWVSPEEKGVPAWLKLDAPDGKSHEHYRLTPPPP